MEGDLIIEAVRSKLLLRSACGISKYCFPAWKPASLERRCLIAAQAEALDLAIHIEKCLSLTPEVGPESSGGAA